MDQARPSCELSTHPTMRSRFPQIGRPVPLMNPIRRRPCADPGQKQVPGEWMTQKGIDSSRPVTEASHAMKKAYEHSHHGHTGTTRHSPRNGFTAYFALSSVTTLFDTVACASYRRLDANDWGVRTTRLRRPRQHHSSSALPASTASSPALMTLRNAPLVETGRGESVN